MKCWQCCKKLRSQTKILVSNIERIVCSSCKSKYFLDIKEIAPVIDTNDICPNCKKLLKVRYNFKTNQKFLGCSNYPNCDYTKNINWR